MFIYFNRVNTKCLRLISNTKSFHFTFARCLSDEKKIPFSTKKTEFSKTNEEKKSQLKSFSFIPLNKIEKTSSPKNESIKTQSTPKEDQHKQPYKQPEKQQKQPNKLENSVFSQNNFSNQITKNPEVAFKLGRLLDKNNPEKIIELITRPPVNSKTATPLADKAQALTSEKKKEENESELKKYIKDFKLETEKPKQIEQFKPKQTTAYNFKSVIGNSLKVLPSKTESNKEISIKPVIDFSIKREGNQYSMEQNLKSGQGLQIFTKKHLKASEVTQESSIWSMHYDQELKSAQETLPINGFDEMIMLTNEGKLWRFPIDNEQDIDEAEAQIPFHEHVFLDSYLEKFPQIEPIQEFMVLALNGLSQNSFLSLNEKKEIIDWYIKYFKEKEELIKEALESEKTEAEKINQLKKN